MLLGVAMVLVGCDERDALEAKLAADAAVTTGNPLLIALGSVVSIVASRFISKGQVDAKDREEYNEDDVAAMVRGLEKAGYTVQKRGG